MSAGSLPGSMRPRTPRYQDFIDGVKLALSVGQASPPLTIRVFCEVLERADRLETLVNSTHKANTQTDESPMGQYESLANLINDYYNWRVNNASPVEWLRHAELPESL